MTIFMSPEYSCLWICNVDDAKVIVIDRICTCSKLIFQPESNKHRIKTGNKKHTARDEKSKETESFKDDEITKTNERKHKICEITYSIRIEGKTIRRGDFWVKIDPKLPL
ncbi:cysteine protease, putative [Medicago truncatula]|uniref:Cysteine protease, putative n=1 Tax=Medicago truncatula TaxID=3880 RepID=G7JTG7_MEDTR|nr:cysteine protease, putative [Medicago truncatula]